MTDEIARLRELLAKATPGPWRNEGGGDIGQLTDGGKGYPLNYYPDSIDVLELRCDGDCRGCPGWHSGHDVELACEAVNALPALLDRLEAAERERDLAIAHDLHPYPTAHAYEKVCVALETAKKRAEAAERRVGVLEGSLHTAMQKYRELRDRVILRGGEQ
jgi:hypothetical protein